MAYQTFCSEITTLYNFSYFWQDYKPLLKPFLRNDTQIWSFCFSNLHCSYCWSHFLCYIIWSCLSSNFRCIFILDVQDTHLIDKVFLTLSTNICVPCTYFRLEILCVIYCLFQNYKLTRWLRFRVDGLTPNEFIVLYKAIQNQFTNF